MISVHPMVPPVEKTKDMTSMEIETFCLSAAQKLVPQRLFGIMVPILDWSLVSQWKLFKNSDSTPFPRINEKESLTFGPYVSITLWTPAKSNFLLYDGIHFNISITATHIGDNIYAFTFTSFLVWILWIE